MFEQIASLTPEMRFLPVRFLNILEEAEK